MPRVSIGLPCYNEAPFIEETLRSVLAQTEEDFELIVCDNASTDGTADIIRRVIEGDARATLHASKENLGGPKNFVRAHELAKGKFFMWMGAHDVIAKDYVKKLRMLLEADPSASLAVSNSIYIAKDGSMIPGEQAETGPDLSSPDVVERMRALIWQTSRCDIFHGLMRRENVDTRMLTATRSPDMVILAHQMVQGRCLRVPELLFFRRHNREAESAEQWHERLADQGYIASTQTLAETMVSVRDAHLRVIESSSCDSKTKQSLRHIVSLGFKQRHNVPWDVSEAATWFERRSLRSTDPVVVETTKRTIEQRLAVEVRPNDAASCQRLQRELATLLKENHRLRRELARKK